MGIIATHECELLKKQRYSFDNNPDDKYEFGIHMEKTDEIWSEADENGVQFQSNGATIDRIIQSTDGHWYILVNDEEYAIMIHNCPFCGVELM